MNNRIAGQTGGPVNVYGIDGTYRKVAEWGFDAVDANLDHLLPYGDIVNGKIPEALVKGGSECMQLFTPWKEASKTDNNQLKSTYLGTHPKQDGRIIYLQFIH